MTTEPITYDADADQYDLTVFAASGSRYFIGIRPAELERLRQALAAPTSPVAAEPAPAQGADPIGPQETPWDEPPADATARRQWEEDVLKKAVDLTGPQTGADGATGRPCACPGCPIEIVGGDNPLCESCEDESVDDLRDELRAALERRQDAETIAKAERERANLAEAERDVHATARNLAAEAHRKLEAERDDARYATKQARAGLTAERERADKAEAEAKRLREFINDGDHEFAVDSCDPEPGPDCVAWCAACRVLRAGTEEAQSNG